MGDCKNNEIEMKAMTSWNYRTKGINIFIRCIAFMCHFIDCIQMNIDVLFSARSLTILPNQCNLALLALYLLFDINKNNHPLNIDIYNDHGKSSL